MDLIVKRVFLSGQAMFGICRVTERHGSRVTASELLHLQTGEPWAFTSFHWAEKKRRAFATESPEYLRRAGVDVPETRPAAVNGQDIS